MGMSQKEKDYIESIANENTEMPSDIVSSKLGKDDREICLVFNEGEGVWYADTSIPKYWRRLEKKGWICLGTQYYADGTICSKSFKGSKKGVTITDPFKTRVLTDEQKQQIKDRFNKGDTSNET